MSKKNIEEMNAEIRECYRIADAKNSTTAAKIRAMRNARKTHLAIYKQEMAALSEKSNGGAPDDAYAIPEEKLNEVINSMVRFGVLRNAK